MPPIQLRLVPATAVLLLLLAAACSDDTTRSVGGGGGAPDGGPTGGGPVLETCPPVCEAPEPGAGARTPGPNPVPAENAKPGDPGWRGGRSANAGEVELYATTDSALAGEEVGVRVSTSVAAQVSAEVFRLGWYGGAGARRVWSGGPFATAKQAACPRDPTTARVECAWTETLRFRVGEDWPSGLYVVKVTRAGDNYRRFTPFVVRDTRAAEVLFQPAFHTSQAYNAWGDESLYFDGSGTMPRGRATEVSYERPYKDDDGLGKVFRFDFPLVRTLERHGYDVTYATNTDFLRSARVLDGIGLFVHGGQDEYWDSVERTQVDAALASGKTSLAYFGGNGAYWRTRMLPSSAGRPLRTLVCYKGDLAADPEPGSTVRFRDEPNAQPESRLFGVMYDGWQVLPFPLVVRDAGHWLFAGTGLGNGEQLVGLVGFEFDRVFAGDLSPAGLAVSLESPVVTAEGLPNRSHAVDRTLPSGRLVFAAGTIYWPLGLSDDPATADGRVERMTLNVLERGLAHRRAPRTLAPAAGPRPPRHAPDGRWGTVHAFVGAPGPGGFADGPAESARFSGPTGLARTPDDRVVVADTGNHRIRVIAGPDGARMVGTVAGNGLPGLRDGPGATAMFRWPTGLAVGADGSIYVADSDNHVIRRIANDAPTYTVTTYAGGPRTAGYADGPAATARFRRPTALAIDAAGNLFVADQAGNRIRRIDAATGVVSTVAGNGTTSVFNNPSALALGPGGALYVVDSGRERLVRVDVATGAVTPLVAGGFGYRDGKGDVAQLRAQMGLAVSALGEVLVADTANFRIRKAVPGATAATTDVYTVAGSGQLGTRLGAGDVADIVAPAGLVYLNEADLLVSDSFHNTVRLVRHQD